MATGLSLVGLIIFGLPKITVLLWILLVARMVNRTTGPSAKWLDSLLLLVFAGWLTFTENVLIGLMTALTFLLDSWLSHPQKHHVLFAGVQLLIVGSAFFMKGFIFRDSTLSPALALAFVVIPSLFLMIIVDSKKIRAVGTRPPNCSILGVFRPLRYLHFRPLYL